MFKLQCLQYLSLLQERERERQSEKKKHTQDRTFEKQTNAGTSIVDKRERKLQSYKKRGKYKSLVTK